MVLVGIFCLTLVTMTSLILGVNFSANLFGVELNVTNVKTEKIQDKLKTLVASNDEQELFELLQKNKVPDSPSNINLDSFAHFKESVGDLAPGDIVVSQTPPAAVGGDERIVVQVKGMQVVTDNNWGLSDPGSGGATNENDNTGPTDFSIDLFPPPSPEKNIP